MKRPKRRFRSAAYLAQSLLSASVAALVLFTAGPRASADDVAELTNGGRVRGTIVEFVMDDHVTIELVDGTTIRIAWADLARIVPGTEAPALAPPADVGTYATSEPVEVPPSFAPTAATDPNLRYRALPRRAGSILLLLGGLFGALEGTSLVAQAFDGGSFGREGTVIAGGFLVMGAGALMTTYGFRRLKTRRRGIEQLRSEGYLISAAIDPLTLRLDVAAGRFVPTLTLRF